MFENRGGKQLIELEFKCFKKIMDIYHFLLNGIKEFSKSKGLKEAEGGFYNQIIEEQIQLSFLLADSLCIRHLLSDLAQTTSDSSKEP